MSYGFIVYTFRVFIESRIEFQHFSIIKRIAYTYILIYYIGVSFILSLTSHLFFCIAYVLWYRWKIILSTRNDNIFCFVHFATVRLICRQTVNLENDLSLIVDNYIWFYIHTYSVLFILYEYFIYRIINLLLLKRSSI